MRGLRLNTVNRPSPLHSLKQLALPLCLLASRWSQRLNQNRCPCCLRPFSPAESSQAFSAQRSLSSRPGTAHDGADGPAGRHAPLCPKCAPLFAAYTGPRCLRCGLPPARADEDRAEASWASPASPAGQTLCGRCLRHDPPWGSLICHGIYRGALREVLLRFKFDGELSLAPLLGACLLEAASCLPQPDALVAVPQHPAHLRQRGFNQAHELAKALHALSGLPLRPELLRRIEPSLSQSGLNAAQPRAMWPRPFRPQQKPRACASGSLTMS